MKNKIYLLTGVAICTLVMALPAQAWRGAGTGYARTSRGGSAAWHQGAGVAYGSRGGSAAWNRGVGVVHGPSGGTAVVNRRPPVAAPAYGYGYRPAPAYRGGYYYGGNYGYSSGQVAAAGVAGLAVGAMAGAAVASNNQPTNTTVVVQQPVSSSTLAIGTTLSTLPSGCAMVTHQTIQYYQCGTMWIRTFFGSNGAYYQVVSAPY